MALLVCNIGWMEHYQGQAKGDLISGGGSWVKEQGQGHEIFAFLPYRGHVYGYAQSPHFGDIDLSRIDSAASRESVSGVTVVWVSRPPTPKGRNVVVGWYRNATVYRRPQPPPSGAPHLAAGLDSYNIVAAKGDEFLLRRDDRNFLVPRGKGWMGSSNIWYADDKSNPELVSWRRRLLSFVSDNKHGDKRGSRTKKGGYQQNQALKVAVEKAAMETTGRYFAEQFGYIVKDVSDKNRGWDLEAVSDAISLRIEVKGLSGTDISVELTPNEYRAFRVGSLDYRLCVVTVALSKKPRLHVFRVSSDTGEWILEGQTARLVWKTDERPALSIRASGLQPTSEVK